MIPLNEHLLQSGLFLLIILAPLPFCFFALFLVGQSTKSSNLAASILVLGVSWCAIEAIVGLALGMTRQLSLVPILMLECVIAAIGIASILVVRRQFRISLTQLFHIKTPLGVSDVLCLAVCSIVGSLLLWNLATQPITEYDSLAFHLPTIARWYQAGSITPLDAEFGQVNRYPYTWEMVCLLLIPPFGQDFLVALPNLLAWAILGLSVYLISTQAGAKRIHGIAAAFFVLTLPITVHQVATMHVDLPFASFSLAGVYFEVEFHRTRALPYLALFAAALGMLLGIKSSGIVYGLLLIVLLVTLEVAALLRRQKDRARTIKFEWIDCLVLLTGSVCLLFLGGFWYIRNLIEVGNPLGYVELQLSQHVIFPGLISTAEIQRTTLANLFRFTDLADWKALASAAKNELSIQFVALASQVAMLVIVILVHSKRSSYSRSLPGLAALLLITGLLYWSTPYTGDNGTNGWQITPWIGQAFRFALPSFGILGVLSAISASYVGISARIIVPAMLLGSAITSDDTTAKVIYATMGVLLLLAWRMIESPPRLIPHIPNFGTPISILSAIFLAGLIFLASYAARIQHESNRNKAYGGIQEYIEASVPRQETIGYLLSHRSYLLYGEKLDRKVVYIPAGNDNVRVWIDSLKQKGIDVVAIGPIIEEWRQYKEVQWIASPDAPFDHVFGQEPGTGPFLYRLAYH